MNSVVSNSQVQFYLNLCTALLLDNPLALPQKSSRRDTLTVVRRTTSEGLSFLTKTLPRLGKALDLGLTEGRLTPIDGFSSIKGGSIPKFLSAYFSLIFTEDGVLRDDASADAVKHIRQIAFLAYKLILPYEEVLENKVLESFVSTDESLGLIKDDEALAVINTASHIVENILVGFDHKDIIPRHGPGAVATGEKLENKWVFSRLFQDIHQVYPYYDYFVVGGANELVDRIDWYKRLHRQQSGVAKVILVPKDSRGPRLISCEPLEYQWIQQGLSRKLIGHLESSLLTRGRVNFTDQSVNQRLALESSISRKFATLDLKDASDRVSLPLVRLLYRRVPEFLRAIEATRSTATTLPSGKVVTLNKFAPMGSAMCFPILALTCWSLLVAARVRSGMPLNVAGKDVFIYGDDIIVPTNEADRCMQVLESVNLRVNKQKSCISGHFRESCGTDAFKGVIVTPARARTLWTGRSSDGESYASYISLCNSLREKGYMGAYRYLYSELSKVYGPIPFGTKTSGFPCIEVPLGAFAEACNDLRFKTRWNDSFQTYEYRVARLIPEHRVSALDGWTRLMRDLVMPPVDDPSDVVVPRSTKLKRGWASVN